MHRAKKRERNYT